MHRSRPGACQQRALYEMNSKPMKNRRVENIGLTGGQARELENAYVGEWRRLGRSHGELIKQVTLLLAFDIL